MNLDWRWIIRHGHHPRIELTLRNDPYWGDIDDAIAEIAGHYVPFRSIVSYDVNKNVTSSRRYRLPSKFKLPLNRWRLNHALKKLVNKTAD